MKMIYLLVLILLFSCDPAKKTVIDSSETQTNVVADRGYKVQVGDKFDFSEMKLMDGRTLKPKDFKGKVVMFQYTASWCGVCIKEMPHIENEVWQKLKNSDDFILIGVDRDEPLEKMELLVQRTKITYPLAYDPGALHFQQVAEKTAGVTRNVVIDKNGKVAFLTRLYDPVEFDEMKEKIFELVNQ